jgi:predicted nucleic acid-binding protein
VKQSERAPRSVRWSGERSITSTSSIEPDDTLLGLDLFEANSRLDARDAMFAAVALNHGIDVILATDRAFDEVRGLERIDPTDERAVATLAG